MRTYPYGEVFAHVVGYDVNGKSGLESAENFNLLTSNAFFVERIIKEFQGEKKYRGQCCDNTGCKTADNSIQCIGR